MIAGEYNLPQTLLAFANKARPLGPSTMVEAMLIRLSNSRQCAERPSLFECFVMMQRLFCGGTEWPATLIEEDRSVETAYGRIKSVGHGAGEIWSAAQINLLTAMKDGIVFAHGSTSNGARLRIPKEDASQASFVDCPLPSMVPGEWQRGTPPLWQNLAFDVHLVNALSSKMLYSAHRLSVSTIAKKISEADVKRFFEKYSDGVKTEADLKTAFLAEFGCAASRRVWREGFRFANKRAPGQTDKTIVKAQRKR